MAKPQYLLTALIIGLFFWGCAIAEDDIAATQDEGAPIQKDSKIIPVGNITVLSSYSKIIDGNDLTGVYASGNFAPVFQLDERNFIIPLYNGLYKQQRQIVTEEEGGRDYTKIMNHNFSLMHKHIYSPTLTQRINGFFSLNYNKETQDESFGDGLYDYRDAGAFLDYQYKLVDSDTTTGTLLFGGKYFFRKYPNFTSLIALAMPTAPEKDEKDHHAWGPMLRYTHTFAQKLIAALSYEYLYKDFVDKHTIDSNGILQDEKREDNVHFFKLDGSYKLNQRMNLGLNGQIEINDSNQNYYDSLGTPLALGDDFFVEDYYDYNSYTISPSLTYLFPLNEEKNIAITCAYSYTFRDYPDRNIRDSQGDYLAENQEDNIHGGSLNISVPLTKKLSFLLLGDYSHVSSNMDYEQFYRYDYDLYHILSGLSYKF